MSRLVSTCVVLLTLSPALAADGTSPIVAEDVVFEEADGVVAIEAEHFYKQTLQDVRAWHIVSSNALVKVKPDGDEAHTASAAGGAYVEALPDTRRTHDDKLIRGENFSNEPGKIAVLHYRVHFNTPGRYYVWARVYSTGSEDNGLHFGVDGKWPASGQRWQTVAKNGWHWDSKQRTQRQHTGEPFKLFLDIDNAGQHVVTVAMREDGAELDRFVLTTEREAGRPEGLGPPERVKSGKLPEPFPFVETSSSENARQANGRLPDGEGSVTISGELKQWHKVTLTLDGPFADEGDDDPNPFTDYRMAVSFRHEAGELHYQVPGYFAADGDAANSSSRSGTKWRAHLSPDKPGRWTYEVSFTSGSQVALKDDLSGIVLPKYHGREGSFVVASSDKAGRDLRGKGRLQYVGKHYLQFAGSGEYFLKAGADAPETLLAYADFDGTVARKKNVPLKTWRPHVRDWQEGDPVWQDGKGKGLIGAVNYLSNQGCNAFSFLTYNAGGDGDNIWPFVSRDDKLHYDCSKLDQWEIVFEHGTRRGMYLHFKLQETEMDDDRRRESGRDEVPESLDGGDLGIQRRLYCRELVARFAHNLALNWNLGEENTQSTQQQRDMARYLRGLDPYDHSIVVHTFPNQQDQVYRPHLGKDSVFTGVSLQNSRIRDTHVQALKWVRESAKAGKPWIVAFDESGSAAHGQPPDLGYRGFDGRDRTGKYTYTEHEVRHQTLWGTLLAGGAGVEYYFGYQFVENDLVCEDWRSRHRSWNYCRIALDFFRDQKIPFWEMTCGDELIGNETNSNSRYCMAKAGEVYLVYLPDGGTTSLDLGGVSGSFRIQWFNPRDGGELLDGSVTRVAAGDQVSLGQPPRDVQEDWLVMVSR